MATRHDAGPGGRTYRTGGVSVVEFHARLGQVVYVWGFVKGRTKGAHVHHAHVVDEEEDEVGGFLGLKAEERTQEHEDGQKRKPVVSIGFHCEDRSMGVMKKITLFA